MESQKAIIDLKLFISCPQFSKGDSASDVDRDQLINTANL